MNKDFVAYIAAAKDIADRREIIWDLIPAPDGSLPMDSAWELNGLCGTPPPPRILLSDLGTDNASLVPLNKRLQLAGKPPVQKVVLSKAWQELIKAAVLDQIFLKGNKAGHALMGIVRPLKVIATCAHGTEPWDLTPDHVAIAHEVALEVQASGQLAAVVDGVVRHIIDHNHLANHSPLLPPSSRRARKPGINNVKRSDPRRDLASRKNPEKLPDRNAFWELVRIVFTESPKTFVDELRFAQVKVLILCGLRIGEVCLMPLDWMRERKYVDSKGQPAGDIGGISTSLMLRYFSEKRSLEDHAGTLLYPEAQHIPPLFEEQLRETLCRIEKLTSPLRDRLRKQVSTGRIFTEFDPDQLVPVIDLYPYLSGNPFIFPDPKADDLIRKYRQSYDVNVLFEIQDRQKRFFLEDVEIRNEVRIYFARIRRFREESLPFRLNDGTPISRSDYANGFFKISDLEALIREAMPTKLSDTDGFRSTAGPMDAFDFLFLNPKRSVGEERNDGICDVTRYIGVGRITPVDLMLSLGGRSDSSIFERYGETDQDKKLAVDSHAFRHLQNSELFRLGIADSIITKRFGRKSIVQSYEYDHRSLAEDLDAMESPAGAHDVLGPKAQQVFKMIEKGKVAGPLVEKFKAIQANSGDDAALTFLAAEADGFHTTPYGFCINSFTVDPCPKHIECFNGCRHLSVSDLPEHRKNLVRLEGQLKLAVNEIESRDSKSIGRDSQLKHALTRLENVKKVLEVQGAGRPFPEGADLAKPILHSPDTVIDE